MNYAEFKVYITEYLWRTGDAEFEAALDELILTAENRLNRDTRDERDTILGAITMLSHPWPLPADCRTLRTVNVNSGRGNIASTFRSFKSLQDFQNNGTAIFNVQPFGKYYTTVNNKLWLSGQTDYSLGVDLAITYYGKIPHFSDLDPDEDHPFRVEQRDLYVAAIEVYTYDWLRDYEQGQVVEGKYKDLLESYKNDAALRKYNGAPLDVRLPGQVR